MRIPLFLGNDNSKEANHKRVLHHVAMARLNPKGFRQSGKRSLPTRIEKLATEAFSD